MRYKKISFLLFLLGVLCSSQKMFAQDEKMLSGNFEKTAFPLFAKAIEAESNYHFYFNDSQIDSFYISIHFSNKPLSILLDSLFKETDFQYAIDPDNNVYVTQKFKITTALPKGFFDRGKKTSDSLNNNGPELADYSEDPKNEKLKSSLENRLFEIGVKTYTLKKGNSTIAGYVREFKTGEPISGASVYIDNPPMGVVTDQFGYFSFNLPHGRHTIKITSLGMRETKRQIMLYSDGKLNIELQEYIPSLKAVMVTAEKLSNVRGLQMGVDRLNIKLIKQLPVVFGEADILRTVLTLPGVTSVGEASTGFNVRGGAADENLILFNNATMYNPSHLFGFFSAFNPDVVKDVELYKSNIPEKFGGRISSVMDISTRDGNMKKFSGSGGISPLTARLVLEGPLDSGRTSVLIGGRTTYSNWLLRTIQNSEYSNSSASFYDLNLNITHEINPKNSLFLMGYMSNDQFKLNSDTSYKYGNKNANLTWKHIFNNKLSGTLNVGVDNYKYSVSSNQNPVNGYVLSFNINQDNLKANFNYTPNSTHSIDFGINSILYKLQPGSYLPFSGNSLVAPDVLQTERALETAIYLGDKFAISPRFTIDGGIRYSLYNYLGAHDVYQYAPGLPLVVQNIVDTVSYSKGKVIKTYQKPEFRFSARYTLTENSSIKASVNTLTQYIHSIPNTTTISPTDVWKLSDPNILPETSDQVSLGYYHNFKSNLIETSVEIYYKLIHNYLDYKSGAQLTLNPHLETDVLTTRGKAYGAEFLLKKLAGKLNGWISYTYSRTLLQVDDPVAGQTINNGNFYPANFDRPNNVNFISNYKFSHRFSISLDMNYSTGRPITLPIALYYIAGSQRVLYSERNQYRIPDYFRADFSMNIEGNHKIKKLNHSSWSVGVYNLTGRKNPYSVYFVEENGVINGYKLSIFGTAIPYITYNFKF